MGKLYCNGKKDYCDRGFGTPEECDLVKCDGCEFADGTGAEYVDIVTNFDCVRNMTIVELAEFLATERYNVVKPVFDFMGYGVCKDVIFAKLLVWLKSEVEPGKEGVK